VRHHRLTDHGIGENITLVSQSAGLGHLPTHCFSNDDAARGLILPHAPHTHILTAQLFFSEALIALVRIGAAFVKKQLSREVDAHRRSDEAYLRMKSKSLAAALDVSFMRVVFFGLHISPAKSIEKL
jgi:hypothetical protein